MSLTSAMLDALLAAGCTAEQIAAVVKADIAEQEERKARQIPWPKLRQMALERDGEVCGYCQSTEGPFEIDHIVPKAAGGENLLENVTVACRSCNRAKKDRQGADWEKLRDRRAQDRERKRRSRSGQTRKSANVTRTKQTEADPPNDIYSNPPVSPSLANANDCPPVDIRFVEAWNAETGLRPARKLTGQRLTKFRRRLKEFGEEALLDGVKRLGASPFHCGKNDREWQADIGWFLRNDDNVTKALELPEPKAPTPAAAPKSPEELAALYRRIGREEQAEEIEKRERQRTHSTGPPKAIGDLARRVANEAR